MANLACIWLAIRLSLSWHNLIHSSNRSWFICWYPWWPPLWLPSVISWENIWEVSLSKVSWWSPIKSFILENLRFTDNFCIWFICQISECVLLQCQMTYRCLICPSKGLYYEADLGDMGAIWWGKGGGHVPPLFYPGGQNYVLSPPPILALIW